MKINFTPPEQVHNTIIAALNGFFKDAKRERAVIGISGGIDSAVVASLAVEALGAKNVIGILMPSPFSTLHSISDGVDLATNLGIKYHIIPIEKIYNRFIKDISQVFGANTSWDTTQENIQARIRGTILMAYSNRNGALLLNTSNKSELSAGYGTLYGDLAGALMVIADIYKLQVYDLAHYINRESEIIPISTITKAPSAELREDQKDTDSLPPYNVLDPILYSLNEGGKKVEQLLKEGVDKELLDRIVQLKKCSEFKKHQMPQIIKISDKPLLEKGKWIVV